MLSDKINAEITIQAMSVDQTGTIDLAIAAIRKMFSVGAKERLDGGALEIPGPRRPVLCGPIFRQDNAT